MAVDGSRWQFLGRSPIRPAPRNAIDNEFFKWLTKPSLLLSVRWSTIVFCHTKRGVGITAAWAIALCAMVRYWRTGPRLSGLARSRSVFALEMAAE